jgi:hyperosmotically inducible protein
VARIVRGYLRMRIGTALVGAALLASLAACSRSKGSAPAGFAGAGGVRDDVRGVAKATENAAQDIGRATADLADRAGKRLEGAVNEAGEVGSDAWITTKVKSELTAQGFDPLHVHVDTAGHVVTLSGTVETAKDAAAAVTLAKAVTGVSGVQDHLFVKPSQR